MPVGIVAPVLVICVGIFCTAMLVIVITGFGSVLFKAFLEMVRHAPFLRHVLPDFGTSVEVKCDDGATGMYEQHVQAEIESDILQIEGEVSARNLVRSNISTEDAARKVQEAQSNLHVAEQALARAEQDAKARGGGWMLVCIARKRLLEAEETVQDAVADARFVGVDLSVFLKDCSGQAPILATPTIDSASSSLFEQADVPMRSNGFSSKPPPMAVQSVGHAKSIHDEHKMRRRLEEEFCRNHFFRFSSWGSAQAIGRNSQQRYTHTLARQGMSVLRRLR